MAEAEIERINAQTRAFDAGDAILTIQADGLEPHLEAFMWEILKKIRARVNAEFSEFSNLFKRSGRRNLNKFFQSRSRA